MTISGRPTRVPLGRSPSRLSYERRVRLWLGALGLPALLLLAFVTWQWSASAVATMAVGLAFVLVWAFACSHFFDLLTRPLNTLSNVVAALAQEDYSFRARGARRGDALGDLAWEINTLATTLQTQRIATMDALTLVERVLAALPSPVLALDQEGFLRLQNAAAETALGHGPQQLGHSAEELGLLPLYEVADQALYSAPGRPTLWSVRRASFRLRGLPHTLLILSDVSVALRREERASSQRLIRVLSHEITNSLTPIQSIAGTLQRRLAAPEPLPTHMQDLARGLAVIEGRATSLGRFLEAYQRLARMPEPTLRPTSLLPLLQAVVAVETRVAPVLTAGPDITVLCDADQLQQALINLVRNAADAALAQEDEAPAVHLSWLLSDHAVTVLVTDNGLGLLNSDNLFVPFYTTKPKGSGIGLALVQQVASLHGGTISLRNPPVGRGCIAELSLPLLPPWNDTKSAGARIA